jgi:hypothetical protein
MKKLTFIMFAAALAGCASAAQKTEPSQEQKHEQIKYCEQRKDCVHFNEAFLFDEDGCLKPEYMGIVQEDIKCFDKNGDGCVSRAEYDEVNKYWKTHTPEPGQSLCDMK